MSTPSTSRRLPSKDHTQSTKADFDPTFPLDLSDTPLFPETSYGVQKAIMELYVYDYTRKGYIDGRILRLPTVAIRAGVSNCSSFLAPL